MPNINFDQVARRDAKEPQITKTQLLEPPSHATSLTGWETPRNIYGVADLVVNNASWGFDALDTTQTPSTSSKASVKQETMTPAPGLAQHKRNYDSDDEDLESTASKKSRGLDGTMSRGESGTSSDDKYGHKTGVIDLTGEDSDDEQDLAMPERQFVPRAEHDSTASSFQLHKTSSPPRTFTRGLEPIAAHPRKPPIVHRQKPPIKPASRQRKPISSASPSPASAVPTISGPRRRLLSTQPSIFPLIEALDRSSSTVRTLECTPLDYSTDSMDQTPGREANPTEETDTILEQTPALSVAKNPPRPFFEEDSSSEDVVEPTTAPEKKGYSRASVTRLLNRRKINTSTKARNDEILEQSRAMRAKARERAQEDPATRANTVAPRADSADVDMINEGTFLGLPRRRRLS